MVWPFVVHGDSLSDRCAKCQKVVVAAASGGASVEGEALNYLVGKERFRNYYLDVEIISASVVDDELVVGVIEFWKPDGVSCISVWWSQGTDLTIYLFLKWKNR